MSEEKKTLNRGLDALLGQNNPNQRSVKEVDLTKIKPGRFQPRSNFDNEKLKEYIEEKGYPIIKHRKLGYTEYKRKGLPKDFKPQDYKNLNPDLVLRTEEESTDHFRDYGVYEGRLYKQNQNINTPDFIAKAIEGELNYAKIHEDTEY